MSEAVDSQKWDKSHFSGDGASGPAGEGDDSEKQDKSHFSVAAIKVASENDAIYDRFGLDNTDDMALALSVRDEGILDPLVLSADGVLLSGHRRLNAAKAVGLGMVPVRFVDLNFYDLSEAKRLHVLRAYNRQRDKSPGERIREQLLEIDPDDAWAQLKRRRARNVLGIGLRSANVDMGAAKTRAKITTLEFLTAAQRVVEENRPYWPLTDRRIHYLLLNNPPRRHDKKPDSTYVNDKASYKALTNLLLRARLTGDIPWEAIEDSTRPVRLGGGFETLEQFVGQETENFLQDYSRNLMQGQSSHVEIVLEKNALRTVIESVGREYCIPVTTGRGFSSLSPRYEMVQRYRRSGKARLVLLMLTDFDPDGEEIAASFARSLRDDFGLRAVHPIKVALTAEDVRNHNLPSDMDAKESSPNYEKFVRQYGTKVVELDAAPVELLQDHLRKAIESVIDVKEFNAQIELERKDAAYVEAYRRTVLEAIQGVRGVDGEG